VEMSDKLVNAHSIFTLEIQQNSKYNLSSGIDEPEALETSQTYWIPSFFFRFFCLPHFMINTLALLVSNLNLNGANSRESNLNYLRLFPNQCFSYTIHLFQFYVQFTGGKHQEEMKKKHNSLWRAWWAPKKKRVEKR
jgi:hypothetical protein